MRLRSAKVTLILPLARTECTVPKAVNNRLPLPLMMVTKQARLLTAYRSLTVADSAVCVRQETYKHRIGQITRMPFSRSQVTRIFYLFAA